MPKQYGKVGVPKELNQTINARRIQTGKLPTDVGVVYDVAIGCKKTRVFTQNKKGFLHDGETLG
jgi:hypothetical protein